MHRALASSLGDQSGSIRSGSATHVGACAGYRSRVHVLGYVTGDGVFRAWLLDDDLQAGLRLVDRGRAVLLLSFRDAVQRVAFSAAGEPSTLALTVDCSAIHGEWPRGAEILGIDQQRITG